MNSQFTNKEKHYLALVLDRVEPLHDLYSQSDRGEVANASPLYRGANG